MKKRATPKRTAERPARKAQPASARPLTSLVPHGETQPLISLETQVKQLWADLSEARKELTRLTSDVAGLKTELSALAQSHEHHRHAYEKTTIPGTGGFLWFNLRSLKKYFDDDRTNFNDMGLYLRGGPSTGSAATTQKTGYPD